VWKAAGKAVVGALVIALRDAATRVAVEATTAVADKAITKVKRWRKAKKK
jgi:hypothetical protein